MYRLGTADVWWKVARDDSDMILHRKDVLKPLGYAFVIDQIKDRRPEKILEIGHGSNPQILEMFADRAELWGIDGEDKEKTVSTSALTKLRERMPEVKFVKGFLGESEGVLPDEYFDLACSVSVVEHVPEVAIPAFFRDLYRILKPGGIHVHSFDVWWMRDTRYMFEAIEGAGFEWLETRERMTVYWESWLRSYSQEEILRGMCKVVIENPAVVLEVFSKGIPRHKRGVHNWTTILIGCRKPFR
jgi:SAM-dependent methyltransferase